MLIPPTPSFDRLLNITVGLSIDSEIKYSGMVVCFGLIVWVVMEVQSLDDKHGLISMGVIGIWKLAWFNFAIITSVVDFVSCAISNDE